MDYQDKRRLSELKKIYLFKYFIQFLEIYGQETFGENYPVNWAAVHYEIVGNSIWDNNMELDNILYNSDEPLDSDKFRDKVFTYIEKQVLDGYPVFRLFFLSPWLKKCYEDEIAEGIYKADKKEFNSKKCYRCKHFYDNLRVYMGDPSKNVRGTPYYPIKDFIESYPKMDIKKQILVHERICDLHAKYLVEFKEQNHERYFMDEELKAFNKFIDTNNYAAGAKYTYKDDDSAFKRLDYIYRLKPLSNRAKCSCFEPIENYDFDKFLERFIELR